MKGTALIFILLSTSLLAGTSTGQSSYASTETALGKMDFKKKHYSDAMTHFLKAAELGDANAQLNLAAMYDRGKGVEHDMDKAVYWYRAAAANGDTDAQCILGSMYHSGDGVEKSDAQAVKWLSIAADGGSTRAQKKLAMLCEEYDKLCNKVQADVLKR